MDIKWGGIERTVWELEHPQAMAYILIMGDIGQYNAGVQATPGTRLQ